MLINVLFRVRFLIFESKRTGEAVTDVRVVVLEAVHIHLVEGVPQLIAP